MLWLFISPTNHWFFNRLFMRTTTHTKVPHYWPFTEFLTLRDCTLYVLLFLENMHMYSMRNTLPAQVISSHGIGIVLLEYAAHSATRAWRLTNSAHEIYQLHQVTIRDSMVCVSQIRLYEVVTHNNSPHKRPELWKDLCCLNVITLFKGNDRAFWSLRSPAIKCDSRKQFLIVIFLIFPHRFPWFH